MVCTGRPWRGARRCCECGKAATTMGTGTGSWEYLRRRCLPQVVLLLRMTVIYTHSLGSLVEGN